MVAESPPKLTDPVNEFDHIKGNKDAKIKIVEYGDFECQYCRMANTVIEDVLSRLEDKICYVFRHFPLSKLHPRAQLAAEAAEAAGAQGKYWEMHDLLFENQEQLSLETVVKLANDLSLDVKRFQEDLEEKRHEKRVKNDFLTGVKSGVNGTPTFFIDGKRYDGPFDVESIVEIIEKPLGVKIKLLTQEFTRLEFTGGILLLIFTIFALIWANSPWTYEYFHILELKLGINIDLFSLSKDLLHWINDGLMAIFFFVVGLEIKREITVGELSSPKKAMLPIAGAVGGMIVPASLYMAFNLTDTSAFSGWGIPMATDIAFTIVILSTLGTKVPLSLRVFFTALAIADDLGAIIVIAIFYTSDLNAVYLIIAAGLMIALIILNRTRVYWVLPYGVLGIGLWLTFFYSGIHPTIAAVLLATTIPTRSPANTPVLLSQCVTLLDEYQMSPERANNRKQAMTRTLEQITERMLPPAQRLERDLHPWTTYLVLPLFALANAGVVLDMNAISNIFSPVSLGIIIGLVVGKPLGITTFSYFAVRTGIAEMPKNVNWLQFFGASCLAGIGFTMSLFIASAAFTGATLLAVAKVGILVASILACVMGYILLSVYSPDYSDTSQFHKLPITDPM
ncbi:MAG: Na+/H+ antiporter NhaA [Candidatus Hodarchaeales archaeon]|jgi:NhaA family Na+:H+ antiporter